MPTFTELANPTRFLAYSGRILPWLAGCAVVTLCVGLYLSFFVAICAILQGYVNSLGNIRALTGDSNLNTTTVAVKSLAAIIVTDFVYYLANQLININKCSCRNLPQNHDKSSLCSCLAGDPCQGILFENGIQYAIANLITNFIRVSLCD